MLIPEPTVEHLNWENFVSYLSANIEGFVLVFITVVFTIIYWLQSNVLFGNLRYSDSRHTILSILQLFFLLMFLLSLALGLELGGATLTRVFESIAAAMVGISGGWGWSYAVKNHRLLWPEVTEQYAYQLRDRILAEPITAIVTIPFAFIGAIYWEIAWLTYPLTVWLVKQRRLAKKV